MPVFTNLRTAVKIYVGARVRWIADFGPSAAWSLQQLKKTHDEAEATVIAFGTKYVGVLDHRGRLPGVYHRQHAVQVRFDDGLEAWLHADHCLILQGGQLIQTLPEEIGFEGETDERVGDLPEPICFYPGDIVAWTGENLPTGRKVREVDFGENSVVLYHLGPTTAEVEATRAEMEEKRKVNPNLHFITHGSGVEHMPRHTAVAGELTLVEPGNVRRVYKGDELVFDTPEDLLLFWGRSAFATGGGFLPHIEDPRARINSEMADFVICCAKEESNLGSTMRAFGGGKCCCKSYQLRKPFVGYRRGVRKNALLVCKSAMERA